MLREKRWNCPESCRQGQDWSPGMSVIMAWTLNTKIRVPQHKEKNMTLHLEVREGCLREGALKLDLDGCIGAF